MGFRDDTSGAVPGTIINHLIERRMENMNPFKIIKTAPVASNLSDPKFRQRKNKTLKDKVRADEKLFEKKLRAESRKGDWKV